MSFFSVIVNGFRVDRQVYGSLQYAPQAGCVRPEIKNNVFWYDKGKKRGGLDFLLAKKSAQTFTVPSYSALMLVVECVYKIQRPLSTKHPEFALSVTVVDTRSLCRCEKPLRGECIFIYDPSFHVLW
jgi:hypothetical protein